MLLDAAAQAFGELGRAVGASPDDEDDKLLALSRFLRDYLYFPLGGNRKGWARRYLNLLLTMLLGGLWHGAGWTFLIWGGLHGLYLVINHVWHRLRRILGQDPTRGTLVGRMAARALTLLAVALAWVLFRAADLETAGRFYVALFGGNGIGLPEALATPVMNTAPGIAAALGLRFDGTFPGELAYWPDGIPLLFGLTVVALFAPTAYQWLRRYRPVLLPPRLGRDALGGRLPRWLAWRATPLFALPTLLLLVYSLLQMTSVSEFLYFQF